jgi:hypothetical protein
MQAASVTESDDDYAESLGPVSYAGRCQRNVYVVYDAAEPSQVREDPILGIGSGLTAKRAPDVGHSDPHVISKAILRRRNHLCDGCPPRWMNDKDGARCLPDCLGQPRP